MIINNESADDIFYVIKVDGKIVSQKFTSKEAAELSLNNLSQEEKQQAIIETITSDNKQLLLG